MGAQHNAMDVADKIIRLSLKDETPVTPMHVQKLTYFCHSWMLGLGCGPLFHDAVESWQYGPVIRAVYHSLKRYGSNRITEPFLEHPTEFSEQEERIINVIWQQYGHLDAIKLSRMTHATGSPWERTYKKEKRSQIIHNHVIREYYEDLIVQRRNK